MTRPQKGDGTPAGPNHRRPWMRLTGAGLELATVTLSLGAIGVWIDRVQAVDRPVWSAGLGMAGFSLGMYRFIRLALSVSAEQREAEQREAEQRVAKQREQERLARDGDQESLTNKS